ncbi:hypothetical protein EV102420_07_03220 [Pseudescherichia vulneris NBRC 102420]|uniref:Glycosyltransferase 2-like domain-containing protein n=1 Tax=Pseudescherichia vulneris NBRC 102420 TaxID=1115515 RepID=A0A090UYA1_PSEVU|nr:glycosyltransferase [Pseudescherichia vulneris]GAL57501.1 hypothetical protein EV102420_07_03220 [Pseudescherichia vulneris NBRC 102420]STQ60607.1 glycosyltransferase [Pseudescherichia vulneris]
MQNNEMVSIVIVTFNSADFIEETLDSCLVQSYPYIEIIVSDDNSTDDTVQRCTRWSEKNSLKINFKIITSELRAGIPANCNRGAMASSGCWIKFLGADDLLEKTAIENLMASRKCDDGIVFSRFETFGIDIKSEIFPYPFTWDLIKNKSENNSKYSDWLFLLGFSNVAPGVMISKTTFDKYHGYDESYYLLEDLPLWYKLFLNDECISYCSKSTVKYRIHKKQVTASGISKLLKKDLVKFNNSIRKKYKTAYIHNLIQIISNSNKRLRFMKYIDLFQWYIFLYNRFHK